MADSPVAQNSQQAPQTARVSEDTFLALMWLFTALSLVFLIARLCIRVKIFKRLGWDDLLVILAWCLLLASAIVWQIKIRDLYWLYSIAKGTTPLTPAFISAYATFVPNILTWTILYYTCLWSIKYSFLVFFRQLDVQANTNRVWWWIVLAITSAGLIAAIGDIPYNCAVRDINYIFTACSTPASVAFDTNTLYGNMAIDVLTDILILSIPIKILWGVQISTKRKLVLFGIFSATIAIMAISVIRAILVTPDVSTKSTDSVDWLYLWSMIEMGVAIMIANVASFRQLFVGNHNQPAPHSRLSISEVNLLSYLRRPFQIFTKGIASRNTSLEDGLMEKSQEQKPASTA